MKKENYKEIEIPSLCEAYKDYFTVGATIEPDNYERYKDILIKHFNSITIENELKWPNIHPKNEVYCYEGADKLVDFALQNKMKLRGHTLVWHTMGVPKWVFYDEDGSLMTREKLLDRMKDHIHTVMGRYKGKICCWDVVNEAIENSDNGKQYTPCEWLDIIGPDYIKNAFYFAHEADPDALLFYNEYQIEFSVKRSKMMKMLREFIAEGVPIHGVGIQSHQSMDVPSLYEIRSCIEEIASLGLQVQLTEVDVSVYDHMDNSKVYPVLTDELMEAQAKRFGEIFKLAREYKDVITSVTFWGVSDDHTWLDYPPRITWPLPFDVNLKPKPAFFAMLDFK